MIEEVKKILKPECYGKGIGSWPCPVPDWGECRKCGEIAQQICQLLETKLNLSEIKQGLKEISEGKVVPLSQLEPKPIPIEEIRRVVRLAPPKRAKPDEDDEPEWAGARHHPELDEPDESRLLTIKDIAEDMCNPNCDKLVYCGDLTKHPYRDCPKHKPLRIAIRLIAKTASIKDAEIKAETAAWREIVGCVERNKDRECQQKIEEIFREIEESKVLDTGYCGGIMEWERLYKKHTGREKSKDWYKER